ncbi:uncharacterized protein LOC112552407 [Pogonomyrmex barbatus]|uniref:Uncharacterized protein LOC112552407 n=1 Tax=Pogonomyrmex barbatus TaxID=144034 RepID=A0A8N1S3J5_9HYME|nr:uncharacterized protein LOC112552407 [Pogonomyrmex barbatus]
MDTDKWSPERIPRAKSLSWPLLSLVFVRRGGCQLHNTARGDTRRFVNYSTGNGTRASLPCAFRVFAIASRFSRMNLSLIMIVATMTFIARRSVPLNKAPVFIERKDISLSNYFAREV